MRSDIFRSTYQLGRSNSILRVSTIHQSVNRKEKIKAKRASDYRVGKNHKQKINKKKPVGLCCLSFHWPFLVYSFPSVAPLLQGGVS